MSGEGLHVQRQTVADMALVIADLQELLTHKNQELAACYARIAELEAAETADESEIPS